MSNRFFSPQAQFLGETGLPVVGGSLAFYLTGSATPADVYTTAALSVAAVNPQVLNALGSPPQEIFLDPAITYKVVLTDEDGTVVWTRDPVVDPAANLSAAIQVYAGDPNTHVAGNAGTVGGVGASAVYDITNHLLYVCTTTGAAAAAVWQAVGTSFPSTITFSAVISPTALAADTNNWAPTGLSTAYMIRASASGAARNITGLSASGVTAGRQIQIHNIGSLTLTLLGNNASSTAANRFLIPRPVPIRPFQSVTLEYDATSTGWRVKSQTSENPMAGGYKNLVITGTSNTQCTVTADALVVEDANGESYKLTTVSETIDLTVSGAGGLDTGAEASNTWYSVWIVYNPTTNDVAGLVSTSATGPTLPSGYTFKARVGWVRNDGSSNLYRTLQKNHHAQYIVGTNPANTLTIANGIVGTYSTTSPTLTSTSVSTYVPSTASSIHLAAYNNWKAGTASNVLAAPNTAWGGANNGPRGSAGNVYPLRLDNAAEVSVDAWLQLEALSVGIAMDAAGGAVACLGWEDNL